MSLPAQFQYRFDSNTELDDTAKCKSSNISRLPVTPGSSLLSRASGNTSYDTRTQSGSRKRPRPGLSNAFPRMTPSDRENEWSDHYRHALDTSSGIETPAPCINTTYRLAGGLDTPTLALNASSEREGSYKDLDFRRTWGPPSETRSEQQPRKLRAGPLGRERNGQGRFASVSDRSPTETWSRVVLNMASTVAGKMWDFCKNTAFRGFYAGGGQGFDMKPALSSLSASAVIMASTESIWQDVEKRYTPFTSRHSHLPRQFHNTENFTDSQSPDHSPQKSAKRIHTGTGNGWVLVPLPSSDEPSTNIRTPSSLRTPSTASHTRTSAIPRPVASNSYAPLQAAPLLSQVSHAGSPALDSSRPASFAPTRSLPLFSPKRRDSHRTYSAHMGPPSPENKGPAAKRKRKADDSIRKINEQLKAMIKEGREALGTNVSVEDDVFCAGEAMEVEIEDEGFVDADEQYAFRAGAADAW